MAAHPDPVDRVSTPTPPVVPPVPAGLASRIADRAPRVLVIGDALLDGWLSGPVRRLGRAITCRAWDSPCAPACGTEGRAR